jgi:hypothetical protein
LRSQCDKRRKKLVDHLQSRERSSVAFIRSWDDEQLSREMWKSSST